MRILVVGATGQIARSLIEAGAGRNLQLIALGRPELDLTDRGKISRAIGSVKPDIVINAAAYTAVDLAEREPEAAHLLNAEAAGWLSQESAAAGAAILHVSTDYVFDGAKPTPYTEDDPPGPLGVYGATKLAGEQAVAASNSRHVIIRTAWVHSPFGRNFVRTMLQMASDRDEVSVVADQTGNPGYAPHIAEALLTIAARCSGQGDDDRWGVFHLAAPDSATWADLAEAAFLASRAAGGPFAQVRRIATADYPTPARRPRNSTLDARKVRRIYGVQLPSWRVGVEACVSRLLADGAAEGVTA